MAVTPGVVQVAPDSTGKYIDNVVVSVDSKDVHRQQVGISDPENPDARAAVTNESPASDAHGVVTRAAGTTVISGVVVTI